MPKIVDHDQYRQELLYRCFDLIAEKGYAAITMRQIAQGLGVSTGTLYHYFPSKEELFAQLVEYVSYQDTSEANIAQIHRHQTPSAKIQAMFELIASQEDYFLHQTLMLMDFSRQKSRLEINQHRVLQYAGDRYEQAVLDGLKVNHPVLVNLLLSLADGILIRRLYLGDRVSISAQAQLLAEMVTAYLEKHQPELPASLPNS